MNIKKVTAAIFTLILVVLIIGAATVLFITSRDEITSTEISDFKANTLTGTKIIHETKSGSSIELSVYTTVSRVLEYDDLYQVTVRFDQTENSSYDVENLSIDIAFSQYDTIISRYCSNGNLEYFEPQIKYPDNDQVVSCDLEGNYAYADIIVKLSQPHEIPINFTYDISGNGLNSLNEFPDQSCEMIISCDY